MSLNRRILISAPRDERLQDQPLLKKIKHAIVDEIKSAGYEPQIFLTPEGGEGLPADLGGWSLTDVDTVARRCVGAVLIGVPFWKTTLEGRNILLPSDYCLYEGGVARTLGLPILAISVGIERRGIFHEHAPGSLSVPLQEDLSWLKTNVFRGPFERWTRKVEERCDVFLGYCSESRNTALQIQDQLQQLGASVLNWENFVAGDSILGQIEDARARCSCGIFLFSEDEQQVEGTVERAAPRDNVVFEAGYFMSAKGPDACLIIRKGKTKMPADVGGRIYLRLENDADASSIAPRLKAFLAENLE